MLFQYCDVLNDVHVFCFIRMPTFTRKNDLICWVYLSQVQQKIYESFVQTEEVKDVSQPLYNFNLDLYFCKMSLTEHGSPSDQTLA